MVQVVTDEYLATTLRQAANRLEKQRLEIEAFKGYTNPLSDNITIYDFIPLIRKAKTNEQLKLIVDLINNIHSTDSSLILEEDWLLLSRIVQSNKYKENED